MAQSIIVNFRMDAGLKKEMEQVCKDMGITMTAAFTMFATKVTREKRIPFEISAVQYREDRTKQRLLAYLKTMHEKNNQTTYTMDDMLDFLGITEAELVDVEMLE